jgi:hypothetical protein
MTGVRFWIRCATRRWSCCGRWHNVGGPVRIVRGGQSLASLRSASLDADVVARQWIPFGPALSARTQWLERTGRLRRGCREEQIVVIRADKRRAAPNDEQCGSWRADPCWCRGRSASRCLMAARWIRRSQDSEHPKCWGHPARLSGARDAPAQCCPGQPVVPNGSKKQAAVPYPGSVWSATQASTWVQVRSSQGLN